MLHGVCVLNCTLREWGSLWNWEILLLSAYQCPYVDCLSPKVGMESVSFLQWYCVPVRMGCFPGRTLLVSESVMGKAAMMATHEPYSSGVIITTGWYSAHSNTGMKPDTGLTELSFTWLFTLVALCFPIDMESWNKETSPCFLVFFMSLLQRCLARMAAVVHSSYMGCICCQTRPVGKTNLTILVFGS